MVKLLAGVPGSGKTKVMINMANEAAEVAKGEVVFVDIVDKHSSMLNRNIRMVHTEEFKINTLSSLYGLLCGMVSANRDVEKVYVDGVDKIVGLPFDPSIGQFFEHLENFTNKNDLEIYLSANIEDPQVLKSLEKYV